MDHAWYNHHIRSRSPVITRIYIINIQVIQSTVSFLVEMLLSLAFGHWLKMHTVDREMIRHNNINNSNKNKKWNRHLTKGDTFKCESMGKRFVERGVVQTESHSYVSDYVNIYWCTREIMWRNVWGGWRTEKRIRVDRMCRNI